MNSTSSLFNSTSARSLILDAIYPAYSSEKQVHSSVNNKIKRLIDILGALVGLALTAIVAVPVAIAMQLDRDAETYWQARPDPPDKQRYLRPF